MHYQSLPVTSPICWYSGEVTGHRTMLPETEQLLLVKLNFKESVVCFLTRKSRTEVPAICLLIQNCFLLVGAIIWRQLPVSLIANLTSWYCFLLGLLRGTNVSFQRRNERNLPKRDSFMTDLIHVENKILLQLAVFDKSFAFYRCCPVQDLFR